MQMGENPVGEEILFLAYKMNREKSYKDCWRRCRVLKSYTLYDMLYVLYYRVNAQESVAVWLGTAKMVVKNTTAVMRPNFVSQNFLQWRRKQMDDKKETLVQESLEPQ